MKKIILFLFTLFITINSFGQTPPPTGNPTQIFAGNNKTIADLTVNGTAIKWYDVYTNGNVLPTTTLLTDNTIYYASQTINTFESFRLAVTTKRISNASQEVAPGSTVANLISNQSTGNTIKWFTTAFGGTALESTDALTSGTYYIEQTAPTIITTLATGLGARGHLDIQADGQLLIANGSDLKIANPNGSNMRILSTQNAEAIAVQSDGKILIRVGNVFSASVVRLNADGTNPVTLASGLKFQYLEEDVDGRILLTNQHDNDTAGLRRIDADGSNLFELYSIRGLNRVGNLALGNDGHMLILSEQNKVLEKLVFGVREVIPAVSWFYDSHGLAVGPNNLIYVYHHHSLSGLELIRYNETTEEVTQVATVATVERPRGMVVDANGAIILFESTTQDLKKVVESYTSNRVAVNVSIVNTWLGITDNTWYTASNWAGGVPTLNINTVIPAGTPNNPMINLGLNELNDLTIDAGATLQIETTGTLTIKGDVTQNGTITIRSDATDNGSLILEGNYTGTGNVTYQRFVTTSANPSNPEGWYLVASPIDGQNISDFKNDVLRSSEKYAIATYDNSLGTNRYNYFTDNTGTNNIDFAGFFTKGKGYSVKRTTAGTFNFSGFLNTANIPVIISDNSSGVGNKWNLIGNPYTSSIALNNNADATNNFLLANATKLDPARVAIYQWNSATASYDIYNQATGSARYIAPGQGFFVNAVNGGETINFTEAMQKHNTSDIFSKSVNTIPEIKLIITDGTLTKNTQIKYIDGTTKGLDIGYDAGTFSGNSNSFDVYTHLVTDSEGGDFGLQSLPNQDFETMIIPVGLNATADKTITISAENLNLPTGIEVYLEDKDINTFTNLSVEDYNFISTTALNGIGRFYIHTSAKALSVDDDLSDNIRIYKTSNLNLRIVGLQNGKTQLHLYDTLGKLIFRTNFTKNGLYDVALPDLVTGAYIVRLQTEKGLKSKKIIIE